MNKEAAVIIGVIMAVLSLLNIALTPEDAESVEVLVQAFILAGGVTAIRQFVYSRFTKNKEVADAVDEVRGIRH